jgi:hypothetical protein
VAAAERLYAAPNDPWDQAVQVLQTAFTGPIVAGGLMFTFGEGAARRTYSGLASDTERAQT